MFLFPLMQFYKTVLNTTTKSENYSATPFPTLPLNNSDIAHPTILRLVVFFTCVLLRNDFCKADLMYL